MASGRIAAWVKVRRLTLSREGGGISQMFKLWSVLTDMRLPFTHYSVSCFILEVCVVGKIEHLNNEVYN